jgi:hypothetical protein
MKTRMRKMRIRKTPEYLRSVAAREANYIVQYGWRPSQQDLANLQASTADAIAFRTLARAWRSATGFKIRMIRKLAGRVSHSSAKALVRPSTTI